MPNESPDIHAIAWILAIIASPLLLIGCVAYVTAFSRKLRYINNEIKRTDGGERRHWIHERRRLWLSIIPFVTFKNQG